MSVVSVKFVNIFSEWRHATSNLSFRCTSSLIHISTKPNRFVNVNVMNLRSPRTTQLKTVHSAGAKNPAASLNVRLHHKTTKFRSNASVQSCFSMFHFVNFKTFFCDSYFVSPDIFITAAQCYPSMHLFMQCILYC